MGQKDCSEILARLIQEYHHRLARGRRPTAEDFREDAGECFDEFVALLEQERLLDEAMATERFPRRFGNNGEFTLVERLGMGGIGIVYKAIQRNVSRTVALKVLRGGWAGDEHLLQRFLDGARKAAQVEHDHVVHIYDAGSYQGRPYIAMSYVPGVTLGDVFKRLREIGPPPFGPEHHEALTRAGAPILNGNDSNTFVRRLAQVLIGPAEALQQYHDAGIVHRDVKPANLIFDAKGRLVLTDFDLARKFDTIFHKNPTNVGTPGYMSPEQINPLSKDIDGRADVYSLGVVLFEGMTQRTPFAEPGQISLAPGRTLTEPAPNPARLASGLSDDACRVALKALERDRRDRFPTMTAMANELGALAAGRPVVARPVPLAKRVARKAWRYRWAAAAALVLLVAGGVWWLRRPGVLHVLPLPGGVIYVDEEQISVAPLKGRKLSPGRHEIAVKLPGFHEHRETVDMEPGGSRSLDPTLEPIARGSREHVDAWAKLAGFALPAVKIERSRGRGMLEGAALPLWPRGNVRRQDAALLRADIQETFQGRLILLDEDGNEIDAAPFEAQKRRFERKLPEAVVDKLVVGKTYRWGFEVAPDERALATFKVVPDLPEGALADLRRRLPAGDEHLTRLFEIALLQRAGLDVAALNAAIQLLEKWPKQVVFGLAWRSLEKLGLEHSQTADRLYTRYANAE